MRLLVLAGGFGTRLRTAIADVPKALAPIGEIPFLQIQIENWLAQGVNKFTFLLHHGAEQIVAFLEARQGDLLNSYEVDWLVEPVPMDTGGAIAHAVRVLDLDGNFLMTNADTWLGSGMRELSQVAAPAMAVIHRTDVGRYGQIHFDNDSKVTAFKEKDEKSESGWINAGLCHFNSELFNSWDGRPFSLERDLYSVLVQNHSLKAVPLQTDFIDIGIPDDYHRFCRWVETGRQVPLCS